MFGPLFTKQFWLDLYAETNEDNVYNGAAALGFYLTLSIFPAFIVIMTVIPYLPIQDVDQAIMDLLYEALPAESAELVEGIVVEVTQEQRGGLLSFGILFTLWTVSTGMYAIMQQLNITYDVREERNFVMARITALLLSVAFVALVIGAFSLIVLGGVMEEWVFAAFGENEAVVLAFRAFRWIVIVLALLLGFALIYRFAPNVEQRFSFITPGAVLGVVLLAAASLAFAVYVRNFADYSATYGSIGAVIILMFWLYIAGLVILIGSEINALVEHYSPEGKVKGEKAEGDHQGRPLHPRSGGATSPEAGPRAPGTSGSDRQGLVPLLLFGIFTALASRRRRPGSVEPRAEPDREHTGGRDRPPANARRSSPADPAAADRAAPARRAVERRVI
jgi:membrane protein